MVVINDNENAFITVKAIRQYLELNLMSGKYDNVIPYHFTQNWERTDLENKVTLRFSVNGLGAEQNVLRYTVEVAENSSFTGAASYEIAENAGEFSFSHLRAGTFYYYRVTAYTSDGTLSKNGFFRTSETPRFLTIGGISNVRDIGGWKTTDGRRISQGLLLRGTELDGAIEKGYHITEAGIKDMRESFGINTDMDLRSPSVDGKNMLGESVVHKYYDMAQYTAIFTESGKQKIHEIFSDFADASNYPVYLHCTYGCDRTGTVCFLLEAMLGLSEEDCYKEYGISNMTLGKIRAMREGLRNYEGATLKEQTRSYLLSCGVTENEINSIENIFLEG